MTPPGLRRILGGDQAVFILNVTGSSAELIYGTPQYREFVGGLYLDADDFRDKALAGRPGEERKFEGPSIEKGAELQAVQLAEASRDPGKPLYVYLDPAAVLSREITMPMAVEPDLVNALNYELDRLMPYTPEQVYVGHSVTSRNQDTGKLKVRLFVVERNYLDAWLGKILDLGFNVSGVYPLPETTDTNSPSSDLPAPTLNLLPTTADRQGERNLNPIQRALLVLAVILAAAVVLAPVYLIEREIRDTHNTIAGIENRAKNVMVKKSNLISYLDTRDALVARKTDALPRLGILKTLTETIPEDTWVNRLSIETDKITLYGESDKAAMMIELLESQPEFSSVEFGSPITKNVRSGKEKFQLRAVIEPAALTLDTNPNETRDTIGNSIETNPANATRPGRRETTLNNG